MDSKKKKEWGWKATAQEKNKKHFAHNPLLNFCVNIDPSTYVPDVTNIFWMRNHVIAPLSEEFTFRACMLPLLLQCMSPVSAVLSSPLLFGIGKTCAVYYGIENLIMNVNFSSLSPHDWKNAIGGAIKKCSRYFKYKQE